MPANSQQLQFNYGKRKSLKAKKFDTTKRNEKSERRMHVHMYIYKVLQTTLGWQMERTASKRRTASQAVERESKGLLLQIGRRLRPYLRLGSLWHRVRSVWSCELPAVPIGNQKALVPLLCLALSHSVFAEIIRTAALHQCFQIISIILVCCSSSSTFYSFELLLFFFFSFRL